LIKVYVYFHFHFKNNVTILEGSYFVASSPILILGRLTDRTTLDAFEFGEYLSNLPIDHVAMFPHNNTTYCLAKVGKCIERKKVSMIR